MNTMPGCRGGMYLPWCLIIGGHSFSILEPKAPQWAGRCAQAGPLRDHWVGGCPHLSTPRGLRDLRVLPCDPFPIPSLGVESANPGSATEQTPHRGSVCSEGGLGLPQPLPWVCTVG